MAVFTAKRVNPRMDGKLFKVDGEIYKDGVLVETETYETNQPQDATWPNQLIKRRIESLQGLPNLAATVTAGDVVLPPDPVVDAAAEAWNLDYSRWRKAKEVGQFRPAILSSAKFIALEKRLNDNFLAKYLDLG